MLYTAGFQMNTVEFEKNMLDITLGLVYPAYMVIKNWIQVDLDYMPVV